MRETTASTARRRPFLLRVCLVSRRAPHSPFPSSVHRFSSAPCVCECRLGNLLRPSARTSARGGIQGWKQGPDDGMSEISFFLSCAGRVQAERYICSSRDSCSCERRKKMITQVSLFFSLQKKNRVHVCCGRERREGSVSWTMTGTRGRDEIIGNRGVRAA